MSLSENKKQELIALMENMGISALREFARKKGVPTPSNRKKGDLMELVLQIEDGKLQPVKPSKRGRPPKQNGAEVYAKTVDSYIEEKVQEVDVVREQEDSYTDDEQDAEVAESAEETPEKNKNEEKPAEKDVKTEPRDGVLEIMTDGYGFLRAKNCESGEKDTYVSAKFVRSFGLRRGDFVKCIARVNDSNRPAGVVTIISVNDVEPEKMKRRANFDSLVPIYPEKKLKLELENGRNDFSIRCLDLVAPIGKGQRAMVVSPPKAGKTTLLKKIANSITLNNPEVKLFVLLVDERPEEVTDMQRSINADVIYSTFDETPEHHVKVAELLMERAKREVEIGKDVVVILDSLTRLARAYNLTIPPTGRTLSGGIDPGALHSPKRFFGSARNIEHGGSLTIIATALVDTGSRMDDIIYEEFKGTGNMEVHLDRKLSEKRIFPALDLNKSGTRREELLLSQHELEGIWAVRKVLSNGDSQEATETLMNMILKTKNNAEFIQQLTLRLKMMQEKGYVRTNGGR